MVESDTSVSERNPSPGLPDSVLKSNEFMEALQVLVNVHSRENGSDTPDFILAEYMLGCLEVYDRAVRRRDRWYGLPEDMISDCMTATARDQKEESHEG